MPYEVKLQDAYKGYTLDQDKIVTPEETVRRFREKLKRVDLDILEETVRIDNGRLDIPVYFSVCGRDAEAIIGTKKQMGKGGTPRQAEASAVMELAERFSFFSFCKDQKNFFVDQYRNVKDQALPLEQIAQSVHDQGSDVEQALEIFSRIPLEWTWAYNLTRQQPVLVPFNWFYAINEFNGPSAGNCVEEAISQGICEVVERHVSSLVSRERLVIPGIDLGTARDEVVREMLRKYETAGIRVFASDFSLDTGIPSVGVLAYDPATFPEKSEIVWTAGTTPNPEKALSRALTEVAQLAGDFNSSSNYVASGLPKLKSLEQGAFIMEPEKVVGLSDLPDLSSENIKTEVERCLSTLAGIGMEVIIINVTHPRLGIPAFYTIIPGAHFRERALGTSVAMFSAKLLAEGHDPALAIPELRGMDACIPGKYFVQFYLGYSFLRQENPANALHYFKKALELDPKEEDIASIYSYLGVCLKEMGNYREAMEVLHEAEKYDPDRTDIHNLMGFCHYSLKEHEKAIECFKKVIQIDPASAIDYANIGSNYRDLGEREKAIRYYRLALELDPNITFARDNLLKLEK
ncbi:MAG: YcaO-like family protein [Deltaproteobacteria bacterium]|nr:YcaO-like family protein [Deltaproteobacteria bacterium]